jgi:hypothetical protein
MKYYVVYNDQGNIISAYEEYDNSEISCEPIVEENQAIAKFEVSDEYAQLTPTDLLERLGVEVKTRLSKLK